MHSQVAQRDAWNPYKTRAYGTRCSVEAPYAPARSRRRCSVFRSPSTLHASRRDRLHLPSPGYKSSSTGTTQRQPMPPPGRRASMELTTLLDRGAVCASTSTTTETKSPPPSTSTGEDSPGRTRRRPPPSREGGKAGTATTHLARLTTTPPRPWGPTNGAPWRRLWPATNAFLNWSKTLAARGRTDESTHPCFSFFASPNPSGPLLLV